MCKRLSEEEVKDLPDETEPIGLAVIDEVALGLTHSATDEEGVEMDGRSEERSVVHPRDLALEMIRRAISERLIQKTQGAKLE